MSRAAHGKSRRYFCATVSCAFSGYAAKRQPDMKEIRRTILRATERGELAGAVALVQDQGERPQISTGGWRDMRRREPINADTVFDLRSITKTVTAVASLLLVADGKLRLDDTIETYLPDGGGFKSATIRQLLTHTSGLSPSRPSSLAELTEMRDAPLPEVARLVLAQPRSSPPGEKWAYSSPGYAVLGHVLETASGEPFDRFVRKRILQPLGMRNTTFHPIGRARRNTASLYEWKGGRVVEWPRTFPDDAWSYTAPDFGLYSTAADVASFFNSMLPGSRCLLPEELRKTMLTGQVDTDVPNLKQGLGWMVSDGDLLCEGMGISANCFGHNGAFGSMAWASLTQRVVFLTQCLNNASPAAVDVLRETLC